MQVQWVAPFKARMCQPGKYPSFLADRPCSDFGVGKKQDGASHIHHAPQLAVRCSHGPGGSFLVLCQSAGFPPKQSMKVTEV